MDYSELDFNLADGEFSTGSESQDVILILGDNEYAVSAVVSKKYARKEVDGRFTNDLPTFTLSVLIAESQIPPSVTEENYRYLNVRVNGITYAVRYVTGTGMLTLTLKPLDGADEDDTESSEEEVI